MRKLLLHLMGREPELGWTFPRQMRQTWDWTHQPLPLWLSQREK